MRTVKFDGGDLDVRSLTPEEIRAGKELGMSYLQPGMTMENYDDYRDYVLGCVLTKTKAARLTNRDQNTLLMEVVKETWGDPGAEKNSSTSGRPDQTNDEETPAKDA